ncbi:MAG TPA: SDR family NAD(P)-dependent oxidoreductase [Planctomycetota bacterium]|nr:SDR family NAD(P)-dependent oxidoreductase [Planctomycetota bacterium]
MPTVLITGASAGIGAATAKVFADGGYDVILTARRADKLATVADVIRKAHPDRKIVTVECDVASDESVKALFEKVSADFGALNVLVNNAGFGVYGLVEETSVADYRANMETNFLGVIRCVQAALPLLRRAAAATPARWGASIVMVSSIVGKRSMPRVSAYCATKFALEALSESLRVELWDERISVSVINPGVTKTDFFDSAVGTRPGGFISAESGMPSETVARVILKAARKPMRNKYLTFMGKIGVALQWLSPSLFDVALKSRMKKLKKP